MKKIRVNDVTIDFYTVQVDLPHGGHAVFPRMSIRLDDEKFKEWNETINDLIHIIIDFDVYQHNKLLNILFRVNQ